ncbi:MAG: hypothetical protein KF858_10800 [Candidatus Sumerlaeia bacterium]|nr:hypothetical protein [Candidatus Sumerlaeia bacterium]
MRPRVPAPVARGVRRVLAAFACALALLVPALGADVERRFESGSHELDATLEIAAGARLLIAGEADTVLRAPLGEPLARVRGTLRLEGLTLVGPGEAIVELAAGGRLEAINCRFVADASEAAIRGAGAIDLQGCVFVGGGAAVRWRGDGEVEVLATDCEFLGTPDARASMLDVHGPARVRVRGCRFAWSAGAVRTEGTAELLLENLHIAEATRSAIVVRHPTGGVRVKGIEFLGRLGGAGMHVVGAPESGAALLDIASVRAQDVLLEGTRLGLVTLVDPGAFKGVAMTDLAVAGQGAAAVAIHAQARAETVGIVVEGLVASGWEVGLVARSESEARLAVYLKDSRLKVLGVGVQARGPTTFMGKKLVLSGCGRGMEALEDATISLWETDISDSSTVGLAVGDGGGLGMRDSALRNNTVGLLVEAGAGVVDAGTSAEPGGNLFEVPQVGQSAIRARRAVTAHGNRWSIARPITGRVAVGDLLDAAPGLVDYDVPPRDPSPRVRWDIGATRATPGYGSEVFRAFEDFADQWDALERLDLGPGDYVLPALPTTMRHVAGAGRARTRLTDVLRVTAEQPWTLEDLVLTGPGTLLDAETPAAATLRRVRFEGAGPELARFFGDQEPIHFEGCEVQAHGTPAGAGALLPLGPRPTRLTALLVESSLDASVLEWSGPARLEARGLTVRQRADSARPLLLLRGSADLRHVHLEGPAGVAIQTHAAEAPLTLAIEQARLEGFRETGLLLAGSGEQRVRLQSVAARPVADPGIRAAGIVIADEASVRLESDGFESTNARPGVRFGGQYETLAFRRGVLALEPAWNSLETEEVGLEFSLRGARSSPVVAATQVSGFDVGLLMAAAHDDPTTVLLGGRRPVDANRFVRNAVGVRVASPSASLAVREDRGRNRYAENGAGFLVEAGSVLIENARIENNQTGVVVRGGIVDLGGGALGSTGGNVLWPQAGAFAILNDSPAEVAARFCQWGEMGPFVETDAAPIRDRRRDPAVGPVFTDPAR